MRAVTGVVTASPLCMREVESVIDVPCLSIDAIVNGSQLLPLLQQPRLLMREAA